MRVNTPAQQLLFCTSLVQTGTTAGTAFVWNAQSGSSVVPVLVTNKHVAMQSGPGSFSLATSDGVGGVKLGERIDFAHRDFASLWTGHPTAEVDLAATFLGPFINNAAATGRSVFWKGVADELCPTDDVAENDLDAIEPIVFVGYPNALFDKANLTPITRRGYTATPISLNYNGLSTFLIDASVFPGSSGSPVFVYNESGYRTGGTFHLAQQRILFVGVVAAVHIQKDTGNIVTTTLPRIEVNQLMDLGIVYNWRAVRETVEALFAAHGVPYGAAPQPTPVVTEVEITTQGEPPRRPDDVPM
ncbi:MAG: hypothetical protein M0008_12870 [Actinomycetota bacterium]|nr:hypothetical protein [Actinomycetota bacterium]